MKNYTICFDDFRQNQLNYRESILTLANTYIGMRGIEDELPVGSIPGCYIAGLFDKSECLVSEIVNFPSLLPIYLIINNEKISSETCEIVDYHRELNMKNNMVLRDATYKTKQNKLLRIKSRRFLSFYDLNCGAICLKINPLNFSGKLKIITEYDSSCYSREGIYFYDERVKHYNTLKINNQHEDNFYTRLQLRDSRILVDISSFITCLGTKIKRHSRKIYGERVIESLDIDVIKNEEVLLYKYFVVTDSREINKDHLKDICITKLERMKTNGFDEESSRSTSILNLKWQKSNVVIEGDEECDLALRFNIYKLITLGNENTFRFAIGAKGLSTGHYGGHYFWDTEVYLLWFYLNTNPAVAKNLLKFRYSTLERAKIRAKEMGFKGCLWAWESDDKGEEGIRQTVKEDGVILRRHILDQYHIVSDIAFVCFKYLNQTEDEYFFRVYLTPLIVEGMRFWMSYFLNTNNKDSNRYEIKNVMGPDEYHPNVNNNYYTNFLTKYIFKAFFEYYDSADEKQRYDINIINRLSEEECDQLRHIGKKIYVPEIKNNVIEQFDGYFNLRDLKIRTYAGKGLPAYPDESVGKGLPDTEHQDALQEDASSTQLIKQADVVLVICQDPLSFSFDIIRDTFDYYLDRTLQYSSLSPGTYALAGALAKRIDHAYRFFKICMNMDLKDIKQETHTGLHTACHGSVYQSVIQGFAGVRAEKEFLYIDPCLPRDWKSIEFLIIYRGIQSKIKVEEKKIFVSVLSKGRFNIKYNDSMHRCSDDMDMICFEK